MENRNKTPGWTSKFSVYAGIPFNSRQLALILLERKQYKFPPSFFFLHLLYIFGKHIAHKCVSTISHIVSLSCLTSSSSVLVIWTSSWLWASACLSLASKSAKKDDGKGKYAHTRSYFPLHYNTAHNNLSNKLIIWLKKTTPVPEYSLF